MKIYVAGKWEDRDIIKYIQRSLIKDEHKITCDWTNHSSHSHSMEYAIADLEGVRNCNLLIAYMMHDYIYKGAWAEIGAALILNKPVIIIGNRADSGIFVHHPLVHKVNNIQEMLDYLQTIIHIK